MRCREEHRGGHIVITHGLRGLFRAAPTTVILFCIACSTQPLDNAFFDAEAADAPDIPDTFAWTDDGWLAQLAVAATQTGGNGWSQSVPFAVPEGTTSLQIQLTAQTGHLLQLAELTSGENPIVPGDWLKASDQPWLYLDGQERVRASAWQAAFLVPNAPQIPVTPGLWQLRTFAFDYDPQSEARAPTATTLDVQITLMRKPNPHAGSIDLNLCLTGARGITAATAPTHPRVQDALGTVTQAWAQVGVTIGEVRYFDVPATALSVTHDDGQDLQLATLLRLAAGQPAGIPIFLVESVDLETSSGLVPAAGFTAGLPAPVAIGGPRTGIVVALKYDQPDMLGVVMAHELGHFLGLFHVVEAHAQGEVAIEDRLPDTAPTPDNLMYYAPDPANLKLTPQQGAVVLGGPWVRP